MRKKTLLPLILIITIICFARIVGAKEISQIELGNEIAASPKVQESLRLEIVNDSSSTNGKWTLKIMNVLQGEYSNILVPVWTIANNQDDIIWYEAEKIEEDGEYASYKVDIDIKKHKNNVGLYAMHVYGECTDKKLKNIAKETIKVPEAKGELEVYKINECEWSAKLCDVKSPYSIKKIQFPTWSEINGQDDIKWYEPIKQVESNGEITWSCKIKVSNHLHLGTYLTHAYVIDTNNKYHQVGTSQWTTSIPQASNIEIVDGSYDSNKGSVKVKLKGINSSELVEKVQFPTWQKNNQSDIVWYDAQKIIEKDGSVSYVSTIDISKHQNHFGIYNLHAYILDVTHEYRFQKTINFVFNPTFKSMGVEDSTDGKITYPAFIKDLNVPGKFQKVEVAVWSSENNQDDIKWYEMSNNQGNYSCSIKTKYLNHFGECNAHFYVKLNSGEMVFLGSNKFNVQPASSKGQIHNNINGSKGTFGMISVKPESFMGIKKVEFAVWRNADQSDIKWYEANKQKDGNYTAIFSVLNHKLHFGKYNIHCYVTTKKGTLHFVGKDEVEINADNYTTNTTIDVKSCKLTIINPNVNGVKASEVYFPTWSSTNNQDDLVWYKATNVGNDTWEVIVESRNHKHGGVYYSHVYGIVNGKDYCVAMMDAYNLKINKSLGIDVSQWQGTINWPIVKMSGIDFVIIRVGYGWYGYDNYFARNVIECERNNIPYGIYLYSHATNENEALAEAEFVLGKLGGRKVTYPIYYDVEDASIASCNLTATCKTFCDRIQQAGYRAGIYSSLSWWNTKLANPILNNYSKWVAAWNDSGSSGYQQSHDLWQYSSKGSVPGISRDVDMDYMY